MPLHDWSKTRGWSGVHLLWMGELVRWLKPRLPDGFRAYIGTSPVVAVDDPEGQPDVAVRRTDPTTLGAPQTVAEQDARVDLFQPDREVVLATLEEDKSVYVEYGGRLIAAVELVSPKNKNGATQRTQTTTRFLGYLTNGVNLLFVDPHPNPIAHSLADMIAARLELADEPPLPPPHTVSYRVGAPGAFGGRYFALRRRVLEAGSPLPQMPLALNEHLAVMVDLEATYMRAAADAYLA
jgi:hypothetical protein